jgi:polysaccharide biosynthesis PFTS motif protein
MTVSLKYNFIKNSIVKRAQRRVRADMKAYRHLKDSGNFMKVNEVKRALDVKECITGGVYSSHIFGAATGKAERVVRQLLFRGLIENKINTHLIRSLADQNSVLSYPLPREWHRVVRGSGVKITVARSAFLFAGFVAAKFFQGILNIGKLFFLSVKATALGHKPKFGRHVFFASLQTGNIPHKSKNERSYDIVSWYAQWEGRKKELDSLVHSATQEHSICIDNAAVLTTPFAVQPVADIRKLLQFFSWTVKAVFIALLDLLRNRWWHALMLGEAANAALVRIHDPKDLAADYLFHNSLWIYRPMWTYEAAAKGSRILFYFYSTNLESFKRDGKYPEPYVGFKTGTWPEYLVWDEDQAVFIRNIVSKEAVVRAVGPIWFQSSDVAIPPLRDNTVAVFDIQPARESFYAAQAIDFDYYTPKTCTGFLRDTYAAIGSRNGTLAHKIKRNSGHHVHYEYRNLVKSLENKDHYLSVDPGLAPQELIGKCTAVISMPFTSTALIGREMGKPSVYYDPHGLLQKDDKGAHGIPILSGRVELDAWLDGVFQK